MNAIAAYKKSRQVLFREAGIAPQSEIIQTNGPVRNVHYLKIGSGRPLLLLHGGGSHASEWIPILKTLSRHYCLLVPDRPGHGLSDPFDYRGADVELHAAEFIGSFLDATGIKRTLIAGHSMGGYFSLCFSLKAPERVEKLLLIGAPAGLNRWIPPILRLLGTAGLNKFLTKTVAKPGMGSIRTIYRQLLVKHPEKLSETFYSHCCHNQELPGYLTGFTSLLERVLTLRGWREDLYLGARLSELKIPVVFIWGTFDCFEKPVSGRKKAQVLPNASFIEIPDAGHCLWLDRPEICAQTMISHFGENIHSSIAGISTNSI